MHLFSQKITHYLVYAVSFFLIAFFLACYFWFNSSLYRQQWFLSDVVSQNADLFEKVDFLDLNVQLNSGKIARLDDLVASVSGSLGTHWLGGDLGEAFGSAYLAQGAAKKSLEFFQGGDAEWLYNRSNAQLVASYQLVAQSSFYTGLRESFWLIYQSISGYQLAFEATTDPFLRKKIETHLTMARNLATVTTVKFVLAQLRFVVDSIDLISRQITYMTALFSQQKALISVGGYSSDYQECLQQYWKNIQLNLQSFGRLSQLLGAKRTLYFKTMVDCVDDPSLCLKPLSDSLIESLSGVKNQFSQLMIENDSILLALKKKDADFLTKLCQWDSMGENQSELQKSLDELMNNLGAQEPKKSDQSSGSSQEIFYENLPVGEDDKLMNQIYEQNLNRIHQMQTLKSDKNYNPGEMLRELFIEFYGKESF